MLFIGKQELTSSFARAKFVSGVTDLFALLYHLGITIFFRAINLNKMVYFNFFSIIIFASLLIAIFRVKSFVIPFSIAYAEVILHQIHAEIYLGSGTAFHFFILMMGFIPFLVFENRIKLAIPSALLSSVFFIWLETKGFKARYELPEFTFKMIRNLNITITILVIIIILYIFTKIMFEIENNLENKNKSFKKEISMASTIQQSFFKQDISDVENYQIAYYLRPMSGVSGDLIDFYKTGKNLDGVGLFDVSGHGIASGLVTMLVKNIIHQEFYTKSQMDLWEILNNINGRIIEEKGDIENYLTGILIRTNKNNLEIAIAGHPKPIIYHHKTGVCEFLKVEKESMGAIGIPGFPVFYTSELFDFEEGDELFIYSDGLCDLLNEKKQSFGKERLLKLIEKVCVQPAKSQAMEIEKQLAIYRGKMPQVDDLTFVILKK